MMLIELAPGPQIAIGLMSGTSHDGINAALVEIDLERRPPVTLIAFKSYGFEPRLRRRLLAASGGAAIGAGELSALNFSLGRALAQAAIGLARGAGMPLERVAFIGSHGHTFFHLPPRRTRRGQIPSTLQLGESAVIAALTGRPVVDDFRPMDIALGGEGAPLAPLAHRLLFGDPKLGRVVENLGGIGNATYLPPGAEPSDPRLVAFDTGPANMLIDGLMARLSAGRARMDRDGRMGARGRVHPGLLKELLRHRFFARRPPKSTGREEFGAPFVERVMRRARALRLSAADTVATATALTAHSIAQACRHFVMPLGAVDQLIVTGGGARNPTLVAMLQEQLSGIAVMRAEALGVDSDALEAIAFALLGHALLRGQPGNFPSVTGARIPAVLGKLTPPPSGWRPPTA